MRTARAGFEARDGDLVVGGVQGADVDRIELRAAAQQVLEPLEHGRLRALDLRHLGGPLPGAVRVRVADGDDVEGAAVRPSQLLETAHVGPGHAAASDQCGSYRFHAGYLPAR